MNVDVKTLDGAGAGTVELDDAFFGIQPNVPVMHQVVTAQLAAARAGTQSTKTRAEVRGGGAKPGKQKGLGRGRAGSTRQPNFVGGGVSHAPKPRSYAQRTPKKMVRLALYSALSDRASEGRVLVVDAWSFEAPSTKRAIAALGALGCEGRTLVVLGDDDQVAGKSFRNLKGTVHPIWARELNTYDVLLSDYVVFSRDSLPVATDVKRGGAPKPETGTPVAIASAPNADETAEEET